MAKNKAVPKAAIALIILVLSILYIQWKGKDSQGISSESITRLPSFSTEDIFGRPVKSREIKGRVLYIQFLKGSSPSNLSLLEEVYFAWEKERLFMVAIIDSPNEVTSRLSVDHPRMVIINRDYEAMRKLFKAPVSTMYYLFDTSGALVAAGQTDLQSSAGLRSPLNRLLKNKVFDVSYIMPGGTRVQEHEWLGQIEEVIGEDPNVYHVIAMFARFCAGCSSGMIIERLREFYSKNKALASVTCILGSAFTNQDARNMSTMLDLPFRVIVADKPLGERWNWAINEFSENDATDIVLVIDRTGKVVKTSYPTCSECWTQLIDYLNALPGMH
ncbi:MAG: hypothetical protein MIO92_16425 [Methanosarcinaceae archaeon]|nr:hypothetical protein [Methanosarcinaceae archaeon]